MPKDTATLRIAILEVVESQLRLKKPPETQRAFDRLLAQGYSAEEAKLLIANVLASEIIEFLNRRHAFDEARFAEALDKLPEIEGE